MVEKQQTKDKTNNIRDKKNSLNHDLRDGFSVNSRRSSWSGLSERYKNVWRLKIRDSESKRGIVTILITVLAAAILSGVISPAAVSYLIIPSSIILATVGAVILSSTTYDVDGFTNAHIGFFLGVFLCGYQMWASFISGGLSIGVITSTVAALWYVIGLSVAMVGYGFIGNWIKSAT